MKQRFTFFEPSPQAGFHTEKDGESGVAREGFKKAKQRLPFLRTCRIRPATADEKRVENDPVGRRVKSETVFHFFRDVVTCTLSCVKRRGKDASPLTR